MFRKKIIILGAGLAGLSAAWHLQKRGIDCQIFEKETEVGGLCRSKKINGFTFDYDGHLLHFKHRYTLDLVKELLGNNLVEHRRNSWIYAFGTYVHYPFQANLYGLPPSIIKECLIGFIQAQKNGHHRQKCKDFLSWVKRAFGSGIAKHFMIPYNTKFWTLPPKELTSEWLDGFIPVPSLPQLLEGTIEESNKEFGYNARFWYPKKGGIGSLPSAFAERIRNIHTGCAISEINLKNKEIKFSIGNGEKFDYLISTIPLPEISNLIRSLPEEVRKSFKKLKWNSIFNLNLGVKEEDALGRHWIYFPHKEPCFFRAGFFNNFASDLAPARHTSLYAEVSYSTGRTIDKGKIASQIIKDLRKAGIVGEHSGILVRDINDIEYGYPICDKNYKLARGKILGELAKHNIVSCGRYGSWRYMSMEETMLEGKTATDRFR
ncbi:MAG: FAD-dependent oxidoreductase [Candidatus Omnitrophica bacterium]|nr:FAD-dependent oxidoreductase [Candidatus Omnitrophota bacterium]MDD5552721.1 FAD-dependent oxidoreductase [Candidatus Omnitrophota bacterium]